MSPPPRKSTTTTTTLLSLCLSPYNIDENAINKRVEIATVEELNQADKHTGATPLIHIIRYGNAQIARRMIDQGANVNVVDELGWTPLIHACQQNMHDLAICLINAGADVNLSRTNLISALFSACCHQDTTLAHVLMKQGADVNFQTRTGFTPLMMACKQHLNSVANELISKGADARFVSRDNMSAITYAAYRCEERVIKRLVDAGADIHHVDRFHNTPLSGVCSQGFEDIALQWINNHSGIAVDHGNGEKSDTPLVWACRNGLYRVVTRLISKGADVNQMDMYQNTPLIYACSLYSEHPTNERLADLVYYLVNQGADVNLVNANGESPLFHACLYAVKNSVSRFLIDQGANVFDIISVPKVRYSVKAHHAYEDLILHRQPHKQIHNQIDALGIETYNDKIIRMIHEQKALLLANISNRKPEFLPELCWEKIIFQIKLSK